MTDKLSVFVDDKEKGAVGLATPNLTGANKALPVSHNSSMEMLIRAWNRVATNSEYGPNTEFYEY